jgi:hypothetical protein
MIVFATSITLASAVAQSALSMPTGGTVRPANRWTQSRASEESDALDPGAPSLYPNPSSGPESPNFSIRVAEPDRMLTSRTPAKPEIRCVDMQPPLA